MKRHICIHAHFYQPPRENPWLEDVELQDSAYPYHDWNERIAMECYAPNTASRILDKDKRIIDIVSNYSKISFNFGPTLLSWMENNAPDIYEAILQSDSESQKRFSGHGSALAQCYNHLIMPLANRRDKITQVAWGIRDFESRFKRFPEGMWLPETAVDSETLDILAEYGIKFTILAPRQAKGIKKIGEKSWFDVSGEKIDPKVPYLCRLKSGREITLFFYDGPIARDLAFGGLLSRGENLSKRLVGAFTKDGVGAQLSHIATDGESYGHHHRYGDMALAYGLYSIEKGKLANITNYGEFLEKNPPSHEVDIFENSSWSCVHGIERWRENCGCNSGRQWHQEWRAPLRGALNWLRDNLEKIYEEQSREYLHDPWKARNDYINVILKRSIDNFDKFLGENATRILDGKDKARLIKLLEMQRNAMLMFTSCGWFFDDISGIETVQIIQYAARAIQLAAETSGAGLEEPFVSLLERAPSNMKEPANGAEVYRAYVKPAVIDLMSVAQHFAVSSLFKDYGEKISIGAFTANALSYEKKTRANIKMAWGNLNIHSTVTLDEGNFDFAIIHLGDHNVIGGISTARSEGEFLKLSKKLKQAFTKSDISQAIKIVNDNFKENSFSLNNLFRDEQREILTGILESTMKDIESSFRNIHEKYYPVSQFTKGLKIPVPSSILAASGFVLTLDIQRVLESDECNTEELSRLIEEVNTGAIEVDKEKLALTASKKINSLLKSIIADHEDTELFKKTSLILKTLEDLGLNTNLWQGQNMYFEIGKKYKGSMDQKGKSGDQKALNWSKLFSSLGDLLKVRMN